VPGPRFDPDLLDPDDPFEIDDQAAHLFKHGPLWIADIEEAWRSRPGFFPGQAPADWIMVASVTGRVIAVPLAPSRSGNPRTCRPIGCYPAPLALVRRFRGES
jgi:hypothetical protein